MVAPAWVCVLVFIGLSTNIGLSSNMNSVENETLTASPAAEARCPKNYQVWIAFIFGLVCMVVAAGFFDRVMNQARAGDNLGRSGFWGQPVAGKAVTTPWLGIDARDVDAVVAAQLGLEEAKGVLVTKVYVGSPAEEAEIERGDVIVSFNRQKVKTLADLKTIVGSINPGDHVRVCLYRDEARISVYVAPIERPVGATSLLAGESGSNIAWGMTISPLTPSLQSRLSIPDKVTGVVVVEVSPNGLAAVGGVRPGDLIRSVNHRKTEDMESFFKVLSEADEGLLLDIYRAGELMYISVGTPKMPAPPIPANTGIRSVAGVTAAGIPTSAMYVAGSLTASTTGQIDVCVCPVCKTTVVHPLGTPCSQLSCPVCGTRMIKAST